MLLHTSSAFIMRNETRHANRLCYLFRAATLLIEDHLDSGPPYLISLCRTDEPAFTMMHLATSFSIYSAPSCLCLETKLRIEDEIISSNPKRPTCRSTFNRKYSSKIWIEFPYLCIYHTRHYGLFTTLVFRFHLLMNLFTRNRIYPRDAKNTNYDPFQSQ